ncbi:P-II family nitrogen regulator [Nostoc sp. FACHB-973]|uniref:P-II family nitrogen regulator n=1 Tax=Desmonostoc muscorum LEGE 12446 TaxID=1828758 RepID=A0A8J7AJW1_DESMC|nr:P-II family nitrogen regulator [Desmonostoc muscorum]MBD2514965.1 P-II family nitrogen regulator [Nostoc sp. FACHB-973]MBX9258706.1 P-II family nitrogen regulator [Desmonostoc muscorum CCALA 125]MCF2148570.1 P-II family nitrogen regulator [Desmonostoc muscorum LEGE 12446]
MHLVKKIEIIANSFELGKILDTLDKSGVHGHAVIRNVAGKGLRGTAEDLDMTMLDNVYIIAFCMPEEIKRVVENLKPLLNKFGGTCYVSDVMEIRSMKCVASL